MFAGPGCAPVREGRLHQLTVFPTVRDLPELIRELKSSGTLRWDEVGIITHSDAGGEPALHPALTHGCVLAE